MRFWLEMFVCLVAFVSAYAIAKGWLVPRSIVRHQQQKIDAQARQIEQLEIRLAASEKHLSTMARTPLDITPMPKETRPQDAPTEEWVRNARRP